MTDSSDATVVLLRVPSEWEGGVIVDALADHGVNAQVSGALTSAFRAEVPGMVRVIVREGDLAAARDALAEIRREAAHIDWSKVDLGEKP